MRFTKFVIRRFKGIKEVKIDLEREPRSLVYPIVGLNESGKTTVLEALRLMAGSPYDLTKTDPTADSWSTGKYNTFIPVSERYNFNGTVEFESSIRYENADTEKIREYLLQKHGLALVKLEPTLTITKELHYKDSVYERLRNLWSLKPTVREKGRGKRAFTLTSSHSSWLPLANFIEELIPKILYFKSEVFDIPKKIYVFAPDGEKDETQQPVNIFYREVVQDILYAIHPALNIDEHLVRRRRSTSEADLQALSGLLQKIGQHVTDTVMSQWEQIFSRRLKDKRVQAVCELEKGGNIFFTLRLEDGGELFEISERSTGFRWFFAFILLTQYRGYRNDTAVFVYDEPASNLHPAAQRQLIRCFANLPRKFTVLYSTHSHYLINPDWLDSTMVVKNLAASPESDSQFELAKTNIQLLPYRQFVSKNPSGISYFQPILDVLNYVPSDFNSVSPAVLVEGKSDFYALTYLAKVCMRLSIPFSIIPCGGSGTADQLIALYAGWGRQFVVLLDSDKAGRNEKSRYQEKFGSLLTGRLLSYDDIDPALTNSGIEKVVGEKQLHLLQQMVFPGTEYKKSDAQLAIQELLVKERRADLSRNLQQRLHHIITDLSRRLGVAENVPLAEFDEKARGKKSGLLDEKA